MTADANDELPAGAFGAWADALDAAVRGAADMDVPCGECIACCTSGQFVHIAPDEVDTLARIPSALRFPAPFAPKGHVLLGYDEHGRCPMLVDGRCSIYEHRPRTCRTYDCRLFAATGVAPDADKPLIARRAARWRFDLPAPADETLAQAAQRAARFVEADDDARTVAVTATQHAVLAMELAPHFATDPPDLSAVHVVLRARADARRRR